MTKPEPKYVVFSLQGGIGKHVASTAVCKAIKKNYPERELVVLCAWPEIFHNLPYVHRVFQSGNTQYFYQTFIDGRDTEIFAQEPYLNSQHVNKRQSLIKTWVEMYGMKYDGETPELKLNPAQWSAIRGFYQSEKPLLLMHTCGGLFQSKKAYCWQRDMPENVALAVAQHFSPTHQIIQVTREASYKIPGAFMRNENITQIELAGMLACVEKRLLIDSCLQHMAMALGLKSTVLWNATSSTLFGYDFHSNIHAKEKPPKNLPNSVFFDYNFGGEEGEFPYEESDLDNLYDIDRIIDSIEKQNEAKG
jgi:hypothetical protein